MDSAPGCCWHCGLRGMKLCTRCGFAIYCSVQCEVNDRERHQDECTDSALSVSSCSFCGKARTYNQRCPLCYTVAYCSSTCRQMDIRNHKPACNASKLKVMEVGFYLCNRRRHVIGVPQYFGCLLHAVDLLQYRRNEGQKQYTVNAPHMMHEMASDRRPPHQDIPIRVLLLGADLKHIFRTITGSCSRLQEKVEFHLVDPSLHRIARSVFFLYALTLNDTDLKNQSINTSEVIVQLMYSLHLDENSFTFMCNILDDLVNFSYGEILRVSHIICLSPNVVYSLKEIWKGWLHFVKDSNAMQKMDMVRKAKLSCLSVFEVLQKYIVALPEELKESAQYWVLRGDLRPPWDDITYVTFPNVTLSCFNPFHVKNVKMYSDISPRWGQDVPWIPRMIPEDSMVYAAYGVDLMFQDWDYMEVSKGAGHKTDMLSMYKSYLEKTIQKVKEILAQGNIMIFLAASEPNLLPQDLNVKYDRIATGIYSDLYGFPFLLKTFQKSLNFSNPSACILTHHRLWSIFLNEHNNQSSAGLNKRESFDDFSPPLCSKSDRDIQSSWATFRSFLQAEVLLSQNKDMNLLNDEDIPTFSDAQHFSGLVMRDFSKELNRVIPFRFRSKNRSATMPDSCLYTLEWNFPQQETTKPSSTPVANDSVSKFTHGNIENYVVNYSFPPATQETRDSGDKNTHDDNKMYVVNCFFSPTSPETKYPFDKCAKGDSEDSEVECCFSLTTTETKDSVDKRTHDDNKIYVVNYSFSSHNSPEKDTVINNEERSENKFASENITAAKRKTDNNLEDTKKQLPPTATASSMDHKFDNSVSYEKTVFSFDASNENMLDSCEDFSENIMLPEMALAKKHIHNNSEEHKEDLATLDTSTKTHTFGNNVEYEKNIYIPDTSYEKYSTNKSPVNEDFTVSPQNIPPEKHNVYNDVECAENLLQSATHESQPIWSKHHSNELTFQTIEDIDNMNYREKSKQKLDEPRTSAAIFTPELYGEYYQQESAKSLSAFLNSKHKKETISTDIQNNEKSLASTTSHTETSPRKKIKSADCSKENKSKHRKKKIKSSIEHKSKKEPEFTVSAAENLTKDKPSALDSSIKKIERQKAKIQDSGSESLLRQRSEDLDSLSHGTPQEPEFTISAAENLTKDNSNSVDSPVKKLERQGSRIQDSDSESLLKQRSEDLVSLTHSTPLEESKTVEATNEIFTKKKRSKHRHKLNEDMATQKSKEFVSFSRSTPRQKTQGLDSSTESSIKQRQKPLEMASESSLVQTSKDLKLSTEHTPKQRPQTLDLSIENRIDQMPEIVESYHEQSPNEKKKSLKLLTEIMTKQQPKAMDSPEAKSKDLESFTDSHPKTISEELCLSSKTRPNQKTKTLDLLTATTKPETQTVAEIRTNQTSKILALPPSTTSHKNTGVASLTRKLPRISASYYIDKSEVKRSSKPVKFLRSLFSLGKSQKNKKEGMCEQTSATPNPDEFSQPLKRSTSFSSYLEAKKVNDTLSGNVQSLIEQYNTKSSPSSPTQHRFHKSNSMPRSLDRAKPSLAMSVQDMVSELQSREIMQQRNRVTPTGSRPTTPVGSRPMSPVESMPTTPVGSRPTTPVGSRPTTPIGSRPITPVGSRPVSTVSVKSHSMPFVPLTGSGYSSPTRKGSMSTEEEGAIFFSARKLHSMTNGSTTWKDKERMHVKSKSPHVRRASNTTLQEKFRPRSFQVTGAGTHELEDCYASDEVRISEATITLSPPDRLGPSKHRSMPSPDRHVHSPDRPMPSQDKIMQSQDRLMPSPDRFMQSPDRSMPSQDRPVPSPDRFMPSPDRHITSSDKSMFSMKGFMPSPSPDRASPSQDKSMFSMKGSMPSPSPDRASPSQDKFMSLPDISMPSQSISSKLSLNTCAVKVTQL